MTARETLRRIALRLEGDGAKAYARYLRALADRIDAEMANAAEVAILTDAGTTPMFRLLSRLDTDTSPSPRVATDAVHKNRQGS